MAIEERGHISEVNVDQEEEFTIEKHWIQFSKDTMICLVARQEKISSVFKVLLSSAIEVRLTYLIKQNVQQVRYSLICCQFYSISIYFPKSVKPLWYCES